MNKERCSRCLYWQNEPMRAGELSASEKESGWQICSAASYSGTGNLMRASYDRGYTGTLVTAPDFGCVLFVDATAYDEAQ